MRIERFILGLLLFPLVILFLIVLLPLILLFGIISIITGRQLGRSFVKSSYIRWQTQNAPKKEDDDIIDVEVIRSENTGEQNDISGRSLQ